ncbi:MAG: hypothetical protein ABEK10_00465 [Candidatus Nanosalina sp.]
MSEIKLWMVFEALSPREEDVKESLEDHVEKLREENDLEVTEVNMEEVEKMDDPHPDLEEGFSQVVEVRAEALTYTRAIKTVINYGPTYVQIEGPDSFEMDLPDMQESLQEVANTVHQYAQMGVGGVLVSRPEEQE